VVEYHGRVHEQDRIRAHKGVDVVEERERALKENFKVEEWACDERSESHKRLASGMRIIAVVTWLV